MRLFYVHWNEGECKERARALRAARHVVRAHWSATESADLKDKLPEALVVSLDRLPSHGRAIAGWLWEAKKRQHIPIVFEGGAPDKVAATKSKFPNAAFCRTGHVAETLARLA
jgi:hypothetical protein